MQMALDLSITKKQKSFIETKADEILFGGAARWSANIMDNLLMLCYML
jgi:hypothetical protein